MIFIYYTGNKNALRNEHQSLVGLGIGTRTETGMPTVRDLNCTRTGNGTLVLAALI